MTTRLAAQLAALRDANGLTRSVGFIETRLPSVRLFWSDVSIARAPLSYAPGIAIIMSGKKVGYLDDRRLEYASGQYLAVGLPLFFECETFASKSSPLIGVFLDADFDLLQSIARDMAVHEVPILPSRPVLGIEPLTMPKRMRDAASRLVGHLLDPTETAVLAPGTLREIFFHALQDKHGCVLLSHSQSGGPGATINGLLRTIDKRSADFPNVNELARAAGMSSASFHRHFKTVTGHSPLQYFKRRRLTRAKSLLVHGGMGVAETAHRVGYASASQFSRDFTAYFGVPPSQADMSPYPT